MTSDVLTDLPSNTLHEYYNHCKASDSEPNCDFPRIQKTSPFSRWICSDGTLRTEQGPDCHSPLSRIPYAMNKVHKHPNAWAPLVPLSKNMLRAITPPVSIWPNFWAVAPRASRFHGECLYSAESDSQPYSLRKEILSALRTD